MSEAEQAPSENKKLVGRGRFRNGAEYENQYSFVLEVEGGTIRAIREYMDTHYAAASVARGTAETPV